MALAKGEAVYFSQCDIIVNNNFRNDEDRAEELLQWGNVLIDHAGDSITIFNAEGMVVQANNRFKTLQGQCDVLQEFIQHIERAYENTKSVAGKFHQAFTAKTASEFCLTVRGTGEQRYCKIIPVVKNNILLGVVAMARQCNEGTTVQDYRG